MKNEAFLKLLNKYITSVYPEVSIIKVNLLGALGLYMFKINVYLNNPDVGQERLSKIKGDISSIYDSLGFPKQYHYMITPIFIPSNQ